MFESIASGVCLGCLTPATSGKSCCRACRHVQRPSLAGLAASHGGPVRRKPGTRRGLRAVVGDASAAERALPARIARGLMRTAAGASIVLANVLLFAFCVSGLGTAQTLEEKLFFKLPVLPALFGLYAGARLVLASPFADGERWRLFGLWSLQLVLGLVMFHGPCWKAGVCGLFAHVLAHVAYSERPLRTILLILGWLTLLVSGAGLCLAGGTLFFETLAYTLTAAVAGSMVLLVLSSGAALYIGLAMVPDRPEPCRVALGAAVQVALSFGLAVFSGDIHNLWIPAAVLAVHLLLVLLCVRARED